MQAAIEQFRTNMIYVRNLGAVYTSVRSLTTAAVDLSDVLRAELVLGVSAFDHFIHEIVRSGMLAIHSGGRPPTPQFLAFNVSLDGTRQALAAPGSASWLEAEIRARHGHLSFQQPEQIADAMRLISGVRLWDSVGQHLGESPQDVKNKLKLIAKRRNQIAHEADIDPSFPGARWPVDRTVVDDALRFIEIVCETIFLVV